jgi:hypothetical protein
MKIRKTVAARLALLAVGAMVVTARGVIAQSDPVILTSPLGTPGQFSYGFADPSAPSDGQWVAIDFHRDPHCPQLAGFNLLEFVDVPNALSCPLTVDVKEWWNAGIFARRRRHGGWGTDTCPSTSSIYWNTWTRLATVY